MADEKITVKEIVLPYGGIVVTLGYNENGELSNGSISDSELHTENEDEEDELFNAAMDGITTLILAQASAGIDIETPEYVEAIKSAVESCGNHF